MSAYASDDGDKKPSSKKKVTTFSYHGSGGKLYTRTVPDEDLINVETMNYPLWDFDSEYIPDPDGQHYYVGLISLIGEAKHIRVKRSDTTSQVRKYYCDMHPEWNGYVHPAINFIAKDMDYVLPNDGRSLLELGVKHGTILFVVDGNDLRHTGGFEFPSGTPPNSPPENMYRFTAPTTAPPVAAAAAAAIAPTEAMVADSNDPSPMSNETTTALVRSWIDVHAVVNTPGGTTTQFQAPPSQQSRNQDKDLFITQKKSHKVLYIMGEIIPSDHLKKIDDAEEQLRGRDPSSADPVDLAFRINNRKIGSAEDLPHGMVKLSSFRTQHPGALLSGVFILHDEGDKPEELENALHVRYTLLRGGSFGEHFSHITQLDQLQILDFVGEHFVDASLVFFSTKSFPQCDFEDIDHEGDGKGVVYTARPGWGEHDEEILSACIEAHGSDEDCFTLQRGLEQGSCEHLCDVYLNGIKVGEHKDKASLGEYLGSKFLWARGPTQELKYTFMETSQRRFRERQVRRSLKSLHIAGENFFTPDEDATLPSRLDKLINGQPLTFARSLADMHWPHWELHKWLQRGILSHKIIWECVKRGAIMLCDDEYNRPWNAVTQAQKFLSTNPNLGNDDFDEKLISFFKTATLEPDVDTLGIGTMIVRDVKFAKESKHVTIKTATSKFTAPSPEDAKSDFIAIFDEDIYNTVSGDK